MRKYETLIFDLDDTLIDDKASIKFAFERVFEYLKLELSDERLKEWYEADRNYWQKFQNNSIEIPSKIKTLDEKITFVRAYRFILFFERLGMNLSFEEAVKLNKLYCDNLGVNIVPIRGARELLEELTSLGYEIFIATNGVKEAAVKKLYKAKLYDYVVDVISSEEVGYSKPNPSFFEFLFERIKNKDKSKMLMIGDSFSADILGGINNGIDTCWFNPNNNSNDNSQVIPTITIHKLLELKAKI